MPIGIYCLIISCLESSISLSLYQAVSREKGTISYKYLSGPSHQIAYYSNQNIWIVKYLQYLILDRVALLETRRGRPR